MKQKLSALLKAKLELIYNDHSTVFYWLFQANLFLEISYHSQPSGPETLIFPYIKITLRPKIPQNLILLWHKAQPWGSLCLHLNEVRLSMRSLGYIQLLLNWRPINWNDKYPSSRYTAWNCETGTRELKNSNVRGGMSKRMACSSLWLIVMLKYSRACLDNCPRFIDEALFLILGSLQLNSATELFHFPWKKWSTFYNWLAFLAWLLPVRSWRLKDLFVFWNVYTFLFKLYNFFVYFLCIKLQPTLLGQNYTNKYLCDKPLSALGWKSKYWGIILGLLEAVLPRREALRRMSIILWEKKSVSSWEYLWIILNFLEVSQKNITTTFLGY